MKNIPFFLFVFFSLIIGGCASTESKKSSCDSIYVRFQVNKIPFESNIVFVSDSLLSHYTLQALECGDLENYLWLDLPKPLQIGYYPITTSDASEVNQTQQCRAALTIEGTTYLSDSTLTGGLNILSWNEGQKIMQAVFSFKAQSGDEIIKVTEGEILGIQFK